MCVCVSLCLCVSVSVSLSLSVSVSPYLYVSASLCLCASIIIIVYLCICCDSAAPLVHSLTPLRPCNTHSIALDGQGGYSQGSNSHGGSPTNTLPSVSMYAPMEYHNSPGSPGSPSIPGTPSPTKGVSFSPETQTKGQPFNYRQIDKIVKVVFQ